MPLYNVDAIVIRSRNAGEADKIVTLFTREKGKIRAVAKGAKRPTSKFGGRLEIFTYNQFLLASARNLDIISQCETIESFYKLRENKEKLHSGFYLVKLIDIITEERQVNEALFDLLYEALCSLQTAQDADALCRAFEVKLCSIEGFLPSDKMLEAKYRKLPFIVSRLKQSFHVSAQEITEKDLTVSGKIFRELISDHAGKDIRSFGIAI